MKKEGVKQKRYCQNSACEWEAVVHVKAEGGYLDLCSCCAEAYKEGWRYGLTKGNYEELLLK